MAGTNQVSRVSSGLRVFQISADAVENPIDELHRFGAGKLARNLDGFIDDYGTRRLWITQKLRNGGTKDVAIDGGHPFHTPVLGVTLDQGIDVGSTIRCRAKQIVREAAHVLSNLIPFCPERTANIVGALPPHVGLKQHLQGEFAGFSSSSHEESSGFGRRSLVLGRWLLC